MHHFLEAVGDRAGRDLGEQAASFLTVLGNIVAVTSIIAVVSLIQGMNVYVTNAIVADVGADNFTISGCRSSAARKTKSASGATRASRSTSGGRP